MSKLALHSPYSMKKTYSIRRIASTIGWIFITIYGILTIYPLFWLILSSFKSNAQFFSEPFALPNQWMFENFITAWTTSKMGVAFRNSTLVSIIALLFTLLLSGLTSYVLARFNFKLKGLTMLFFVVGMLIPIHSTLVPLFILMKQLSILNSYWALILPYTAFSLLTAIFILTSYFSTLPTDIVYTIIFKHTILCCVLIRT